MEINKDNFLWGIAGAGFIFFIQTSISKVDLTDKTTAVNAQQVELIVEQLKEIKVDLKEATKDRWTKSDHIEYSRKVDREMRVMNQRLTDAILDMKQQTNEIKSLLKK